MKRSTPAALLFCLSALLALGAGGCGAGGRSQGPAFGSGLAPVRADATVQRAERAMFERLNRDRKARGLPPLELDARLSEVARHHSADMRDHDFFEHASARTGDVDDRLDAAGYLFLTARENLSEAPDVESSQDALLDSPPHFANIMADDVTHVGIGIVKGGVVDGRNLTVTQVFATPLVEETPARAQSRIWERVQRERKARGLRPPRRDPKLDQLAAEHLPELDAAGSPESVERAGKGVAEALQGKQAGRLIMSAQVVPGSGQLSLPEPLVRSASASAGLAARRVESASGRPGLQVLLLVVEQEQEP